MAMGHSGRVRMQVRAKVMWLESREKVTDGDRVMGEGLCVTRVVCGWGVVCSCMWD